MSKVDSYSLYQTFNSNLPKKEPSVSQKNNLVKNADKLYEHQKIAFIRLIIEHARFNNEYDPEKIPYDGVETNEGIVFDLNAETFPTDLKWILLKFFKQCTES
jgi:hypothetical protein